MMPTCPVCGNIHHAYICPSCGFDESCNFESYLTLSRFPGTVPPFSISSYKEKWEKEHTPSLLAPPPGCRSCPDCGNMSFYVTDHSIICTKCHYTLDWPQPITGTLNPRKQGGRPSLFVDGDKGSDKERHGFSKPPVLKEPLAYSTMAASPGYALGIQKDGSIVVAGNPPFDKTNIYKWKNIVSIAAGKTYAAGLRKDGTVVVTGSLGQLFNLYEISKWENIVALTGHDAYISGLKKDGAILTVSSGKEQPYHIGRYMDIISIAAGKNHMAGLKSDGTVIAVGSNFFHQCDVFHWSDVAFLAAASRYTAGLKKDGTLLLAGFFFTTAHERANYQFTSIACSDDYILGLGTDGAVSAIGRCPFDVSCMEDIRTPQV